MAQAQELDANSPKQNTQKLLDKCVESLNQCNLCAFDPRRARPLIDVFSVEICGAGERFDEKMFEIYGTILVTGGEGESWYIYDRGLDDPQTLSSSTISLLLTGPKESPVVASGAVTLSINLKDKGMGVTLLKQEVTLEYVDSHGRALTKLVQGDYVDATVHFIAYEAAILSFLEIHYGNEEDMEVYGTVMAHVVRNYEKRGCSIKDCEVYSSTTLYAQPQKKPLIVEPEGFVGLYRSMLPVPIYSFIVIEMDLWIHYDKRREHHKGAVGFQAKHMCLLDASVDREEEADEIFDGDCTDDSAFVQVLWRYPLASGQGKAKLCIEQTHSEEGIEDQHKRARP